MSSGRSVSACYSASSGWACLAQSLPCLVSVLPGRRWECDVRQPIAYWPRYSGLISPAEPAQSALMVALYTSLARGLRPLARQRHSGLCRSSAVYKATTSGLMSSICERSAVYPGSSNLPCCLTSHSAPSCFAHPRLRLGCPLLT